MRRCRQFMVFMFLSLFLFLFMKKTDYQAVVLSNQQRAELLNSELEGLVPDVNERVPSTEKSPPPFTAVVIVTYMRSGSSLAGDILQQSPGTFFVYEPLRSLEHLVKWRPGTTLTFVNGSSRNWPVSYQHEAVNIIRNWLQCSLTRLPQGSLMDGFLSKGIQNQDYRVCLLKSMEASKDKLRSIDACIQKLTTVCEQAPLRVIKAIRLPLKFISHLMDEIQGLKIIHLVRDPRATLRSQSGFGMCSEDKHGGKTGCTNKLCTNIENDHLEIDVLAKRHKNRVATFLYEQIAANPIETSRKMYDFIGTTFTRKVEEYIFNITLAGNPNNCGICTVRTNSSEHIAMWKEKMGPVFLKVVEDRCNYVLKHYNYSLALNTSSLG